MSSVGESNYFNFGSITFTSSNNRINFNLKTGDTNDNSSEGTKIYKNGFNSGDKVYYTISFDIETGTYYLYVDKIDGSTLAGTWVATSTNKELYYINTRPEFKISYGTGSDSTYYLTTGSIDLKSIAIWADGVPIFNGNKTGLDVIKSDNYEKVGNPTVSNDGMLDGNFTDTSNYVLANISLGSISKLKINGSLIYTNQSIVQQVFNFNGNNLRLVISATGSFALYSSALITSISGTNLTNYSNKKVNYEVIVDGTNVILLVITEDNQFSASGTVSSIDYSGVTKCGIGSTYAGVEPYKGLIDLNAFKIYADGNLVYQPCLKIPYTLSNTGSKIVDVYARNRVQDLYEQTGEALYYTIDEENKNFTLPMGEVYGMIENTRGEVEKLSTDTNTKISNCVRKTGDIMTGSLIISNVSTTQDTSSGLQLRMYKSTDYGNTTYGNLYFADQNGQYIGLAGAVHYTDNNTGIRLGVWDFSTQQFKILLNLNAKQNPALVVETYTNGDTWYRKYSDGWIEQGGICKNFETDARYCNVTYPVAFKNGNGNVVVCAHRNIMGNDSSSWVFSQTNTGARFANAQTSVWAIWRACGY